MYRFILPLCLLMLPGCRKTGSDEEKLVSVQLVDRAGTQELISHTQRIQTISKVDFLSPQPYKKVVRIYRKKSDDKARGIITSYHPNGEVWQYLETYNGRSHGDYKEWYENGRLRMEASIAEGLGDLAPDAMVSWVFDKASIVYDEEGHKLAEFHYAKGALTEVAKHYHPNGNVAKEVPYENGQKEGIVKYYTIDGALAGETSYVDGKKEGRSYAIGSLAQPKREETYAKGRLVEGRYYDIQGSECYGVIDGKGMKPEFDEGYLSKTYEYQWGVIEGVITTYRKDGTIAEEVTVKDGQKNGEEWNYYEGAGKVPMAYLQWKNDEVTGKVRTYYREGLLESEKEMKENQKHGASFAWYPEGSIMYMETYDNGKLVEGKYFQIGNNFPVSAVIDGDGVATLFDHEGTLAKKVEYRKGRPIVIPF